jgi:hypothetical protein
MRCSGWHSLLGAHRNGGGDFPSARSFVFGAATCHYHDLPTNWRRPAQVRAPRPRPPPCRPALRSRRPVEKRRASIGSHPGPPRPDRPRRPPPPPTGHGYANGMASRGQTEATTPSHGMRRHRSWRNSGHAPRIGATARAAVHDCRHNEKCARRWCPFVPYSTRYHFGTLRNRSTPRGPQKCERVQPLRRHSPAHRALAPPARAAPWQDLRCRRWLVNQARLLPGADVAGVSPVPVQMWQG